jgi:hypothetical protein
MAEYAMGQIIIAHQGATFVIGPYQLGHVRQQR